jgi:hypothetical protein
MSFYGFAVYFYNCLNFNKSIFFDILIIAHIFSCMPFLTTLQFYKDKLMRRYILFSFLLVTISACGQKNSIFKDYKFDSTYTLLSLSPMKETGLQYSDLCFIIKDPSELNKLKSSWTLSKKTERIFDMSPVRLYLIKDKVLEKVWTISPVYQNVLNDGD